MVELMARRLAATVDNHTFVAENLFGIDALLVLQNRYVEGTSLRALLSSLSQELLRLDNFVRNKEHS